jgi:rod shape-determining protein MreD
MLYGAINFFLIFFLAVAQLSFFGKILPLGLVPELVLILVIFWVAYFGLRKKIVWVLVAGLILDLATLSPLGKNAFSFLLTASFVDFLVRKLFLMKESRKIYLTFGLIILGTFFNRIVLGILERFFLGNPFNFSVFLEKNFFLVAFLNGIFFLLLAWPVINLEKAFSARKEEIKI